MSEEQINLGDVIADAVPKLYMALEHAERNEQQFKKQLDAQRQETAKIRRALSVFDPDYQNPNSHPQKAKPKPKPKPTRNGATGFGISIQAVTPIADAIVEMFSDGAEYVTQTDVVERTGTTPNMVSGAFKYLRSIEFIRRSGRRDNRDIYQVLDAEAFTRAKAQSEES